MVITIDINVHKTHGADIFVQGCLVAARSRGSS